MQLVSEIFEAKSLLLGYIRSLRQGESYPLWKWKLSEIVHYQQRRLPRILSETPVQLFS